MNTQEWNEKYNGAKPLQVERNPRWAEFTSSELVSLRRQLNIPSLFTTEDGKNLKTILAEIKLEQEIRSDPAETYDPAFGDDKLCICGHSYYRHFDTYDHMKPVGCKYCTGYMCPKFSAKAL